MIPRTTSGIAAKTSTARGWRNSNGCPCRVLSRGVRFRPLPILQPTAGSLAVEATGGRKWCGRLC
jgi:hypothetical protein